MTPYYSAANKGAFLYCLLNSYSLVITDKIPASGRLRWAIKTAYSHQLLTVLTTQPKRLTCHQLHCDYSLMQALFQHLFSKLASSASVESFSQSGLTMTSQRLMLCSSLSFNWTFKWRTNLNFISSCWTLNLTLSNLSYWWTDGSTKCTICG